jgi:hypothetical protein
LFNDHLQLVNLSSSHSKPGVRATLNFTVRVKRGTENVAGVELERIRQETAFK